MEIAGQAKDKDSSSAYPRKAMGETKKVQCLEPKASLEIRDLDSLTTVKEVKDAIVMDLPDTKGMDFSLLSPRQTSAD